MQQIRSHIFRQAGENMINKAKLLTELREWQEDLDIRNFEDAVIYDTINNVIEIINDCEEENA